VTALLRVLSFLLVVGIIVLVHEFGHFMAARLMGIRVEAFSLGIGRRLFGWKWRETDFRISLIPLGGFVRLGGEEEYDPLNARPDDFYSKNRAQRFFTMVMGSVMNLLLAFFILTVLHMTGMETNSYRLEQPVIGFVEADSPAAKAGLQKNDRIVSINGRKVPAWKDVELLVGINPRETLRIEYVRRGETLQTEMKVEPMDKMDSGYAGFSWRLQPLVGMVEKGFPAEKAGMRKGDLITAVDGHPIDTYWDVVDLIRQSPEKPLRFRLRGDAGEREVEITPRKGENGIGVIGFTVDLPVTRVRYHFGEAVSRSLQESVRLVGLVVDVFRKIIRGKISSRQISGPIEIGRFSHEALESGLSNFFMLIAFISLQLGIVNLVPIPGLDGGHLLILGIESMIRRDLNMKLKMILIYIGFSLLIALMIFVLMNDVVKTLPNGWKSLIPSFK